MTTLFYLVKNAIIHYALTVYNYAVSQAIMYSNYYNNYFIYLKPQES